MSDESREIFRRLQEVFDAAKSGERELELATDRLVIFSDHHKGQRDGADDFRRCERAYHAALGYYLESGYSLLVLGDAEELWECRPKKAVAAYEYTLQLEGEFHAKGRYERFWGNHDDEWESTRAVSKHLFKFLPGIKVREGARFRVRSGDRTLGTIFFVHGHQGTTYSDRRRKLAKFFVRNFWRPVQRLVNVASTTPAKDWKLREKHDRTMYGWALKQEKVLLIAGHTHRPVFIGKSHHAKLQAELAGKAGEEAARIRARLEWAKVQEGQSPGASELPEESIKPCYFNTGCCSFGDGDITGLEIVGGKLRLVRWPNDSGEPLPEILDEAELDSEVFARL